MSPKPVVPAGVQLLLTCAPAPGDARDCIGQLATPPSGIPGCLRVVQADTVLARRAFPTTGRLSTLQDPARFEIWTEQHLGPMSLAKLPPSAHVRCLWLMLLCAHHPARSGAVGVTLTGTHCHLLAWMAHLIWGPASREPQRSRGNEGNPGSGSPGRSPFLVDRAHA